MKSLHFTKKIKNELLITQNEPPLLRNKSDAFQTNFKLWASQTFTNILLAI